MDGGADSIRSENAPARVAGVDLESQRETFVRIARVAKSMVGATNADVVIVHEHFVWRGTTGEKDQTQSAPEAVFAMMSEAVIWVEDCSADPVRSQHPKVKGPPYIRFYAAAPIALADGTRIGVLNVGDTEPHPRDEALVQGLADLARIVGDACDRELERQALVKAQQRLNIAIQIADLHVWELDYESRSLDKAGAEDTFFERPMTYDDLAGDIYQTVHPDDRALTREAFAKRAPGQTNKPIEYRINRADGKEVWVSSTAELQRDEEGRRLRLVGVLQNITPRKQAEAANQAKSQFLANMSHEIRTPLNGVMGIASALSRTELSAVQSEMVGLIESSAQTLQALLSDLLDYARIESGRMELEAEPFDVAEAVSHCAALFQSSAADKGLQLEASVTPLAMGYHLGDATRLRQILLNLLSNAVKFTSQGSIRLIVDAVPIPDATAFHIRVEDTGIGFDAEAKARLFQRFEQADSSITRKFGGTGLGLAISRALAVAMGGSLEAESEPGVGSQFSLRLELPYADAPVAEKVRAEAQTDLSSAGGLRVLVAEDHAVNRRVVELILGSAGVDLTCVENGVEAIEAYSTGAFDLILMDMQMPVMDGLTAIRQIREVEARDDRAHMPIYTLTANALPEHATASSLAGADGHITKPVTADALLAVIDAVSAAKPRERQALSA